MPPLIIECAHKRLKSDNSKMKFPTLYVLVSTLVPSIRACNCYHNNDAGRWRDGSESPASRIDILCFSGGGCYEAELGDMCISGDKTQCPCAASAAANWQSFHDDWFLWSAITCDGLSITIT